MSDTPSADFDDRRRDPRVEVATSVRIHYPSLERLAHEICRDMSVGGMFVESTMPPPLGTGLEFELELPIRRPTVVSGRGTIVWHRPSRDPAGRPAGFGVQFVELDSRFRELIFRVVDRFIQRGGSPFDLET